MLSFSKRPFCVCNTYFNSATNLMVINFERKMMLLKNGPFQFLNYGILYCVIKEPRSTFRRVRPDHLPFNSFQTVFSCTVFMLNVNSKTARANTFLANTERISNFVLLSLLLIEPPFSKGVYQTATDS